MKNKNVGFLVIGIAVVIAVIVLIFNLGLKNIVGQTCTHGPTCSMFNTISVQTYISLAIAGLILIIGLFLIFSKPEERVIVKKIKPLGKLSPKKFDEKTLKNLNEDEKKIMNLLLENKGSIHQSEIVKKTGLSKVKITRILDSLEGQGFIERKRRGMTNIIILKN